MTLPIRRRTALERAAYTAGGKSALNSLADPPRASVGEEKAAKLIGFIEGCARSLDMVEQLEAQLDDVNDTVMLELDREALEGLYRAWQSDDDLNLTVSVREVFDGQDGELGVLLRAGVTP